MLYCKYIQTKGGNMNEKEHLKKIERDLRLTAFHMAREILTEQRQFLIQTGTKIEAPTTEQIEQEAEKILTFLKK